jgi:ATP-binding cassette, subfamily B, bacterial PglK
MGSKNRTSLSWRNWSELFEAQSKFLAPQHKRQLIQISTWAFALSLLEMLLAASTAPFAQCISGQCFELVETTARALNLPVVSTLGLGLFSLICIKLATQTRFGWISARFVQTVQQDTVNRLQEGYLRKDWASFQSKHSSYYMHRCSATATDAARASSQCVTLISASLTLLLMTGLMLWKYPVVSLCLIIGFLFVNVATQQLVGAGQKQAAHSRDTALRKWHAGLIDAFATFREIRVYGLEGKFLAKLQQTTEVIANENLRLNFFPQVPRIVLDFLIFGILLMSIVIWIVFKWPIAQLIPLLIFYLIAARAILPALSNLLSIRTALFGSIVNIEYILQEFKDSADSKKITIDGTPTASSQPFFALQNITFRHKNSTLLLLSNITITINHPSWVEIIGASGAGKSTLLELMAGILNPDSGQVRYAWSTTQWRPKIAYLPQHAELLKGSLLDNIVFGSDDGNIGRINQAIKVAELSDFLSKLKDGLETQIGTEGNLISGGERQRVAIARALYSQPDLLLMDEATSGLDEATEMRLLFNIKKEHTNLSVMYISHRVNSMHFADNIYHLDNGILLNTR